MPTYDYRCESCGHTFEQFQSITAEPIKVCPECKQPKVRRLIGTGAAVLFKGSGFYQTDYRSKTYSQSAKSDSSTTAASSPSTASSSTNGTGGTSGTGGSNGTGGNGTSSKAGSSNGSAGSNGQAASSK